MTTKARAQHTPGPWEVRSRELEGGVYVGQVGSGLVACAMNTCGTGTLSGSREIARANARLVAAAPDLLDALRGALGIVTMAKHIVEANGGPTGELDIHMSKIYAAIAKARGEQP